jgi:hypothetical protein
MPSIALILWISLLAVATCYAVLWSEWPDNRGGWLLSVKQKLPSMMRLWEPKHLVTFYILCGVFLLLSSYLEYKAGKGLAFP